MKMYLKETNEEITFGDVIVMEDNFTHDFFGNVTMKTEVPLTKENYKSLEANGIIYIENLEVDLDDIRKMVLKRMATRYKWEEGRLVRILKAIDEVHPAASVSMITKEIAMLLDEKYPGHISNANELYVISLADGNIYPVKREHIKSFRNIALFRTVEDAEYARQILDKKLTNLF